MGLVQQPEAMTFGQPSCEPNRRHYLLLVVPMGQGPETANWRTKGANQQTDRTQVAVRWAPEAEPKPGANAESESKSEPKPG